MVVLGNNSVCNVSDHLVIRSIVEVETYLKALKARQSRSKADGSPKECAPKNWEQIIGLSIAQIASDSIEGDVLAEILKLGFYRCVLIFCDPQLK